VDPRTRYTKAALARRSINREQKSKLAQARLQYDTIQGKRAARKMNKAEDKAMSLRPSNFRLILVSLLLAIIGVLAIRQDSSAAVPLGVSSLEQRNQAIVHLVQVHRTERLVGASSRLLSLQGQTAVKLVGDARTCASLRQLLATDLRSSFAYVLDTQSAKQGGQACSHDQVVKIFGQPTSRAIITGSIKQPTEQLLFYDHGVRTQQPSPDPETVKPALGVNHLVSLSKVSGTECPGHKTILQVAAHEDDDLLFMNPDLLHTIQAGDCVRTVYLTAGDAGSSKFYWLGRERGSEAAYALQAGFADIWHDTGLKIDSQRFATMATPLDESRYSLIFMRLPDGKPDGMGFVSSGFESLAKLVAGHQKTIRSVDDQSVFSHKDLVAALTAFMNLYHPDEVRTQLPYNTSTMYGDHSDHMTTGMLTTEAFKKYQQQQPTSHLAYYSGYPVRDQAPNVEGDDLAFKEQAFFMYAQYDGAVCSSMDLCISAGDYGEYLQRQFRSDP
jgi:LmbE family N-acetylglucosaminyl deacetylase